MTQTILVTGATGFIAKHIVLQLLNAGHSVVGSARSLDRAAELRAAVDPHLTDPAALDRLRVVALDLTRDDGWAEAMQGVDAVMHTASPFPMVQPDDEAEVIRPAVDGAVRALRAASAAGVGRVVLTSSVVAVTNTDLPAGRTAHTEDDWTDLDHPATNAYGRSKTLAERAAWEFVRDEAPGMALTVINPALVLGPPLDGTYGTSVGVVERLLHAKDPMLPRVGFSVVDVRDIAAMHVAALERPDTAGKRYIGAESFVWFHEVAAVLKQAHPERRIVTRIAPGLVIRALALFDPAIRSILPGLGKRSDISGQRAREELGIAFIPADETVRATAAWLIAAGKV